MSISSIGPYGSATIVNSDLFNDVETLQETVVTLGTTYLQTTQEHRDNISTNRLNINDISNNKIPALEQDISSNWLAIDDISTNKIPALEQDISSNWLAWFLCIHSTMVKTTLSQMSFHDRGFNSRDGFDSQSSWVPVLSDDRGNDGRCPNIRSIKMCLAWSNMRARGHYGSSHLGLPSAFRSGHALPGGPSELTPTVTEVIFCESVVFTIVL
jgi:hypothetical protein